MNLTRSHGYVVPISLTAGSVPTLLTRCVDVRCAELIDNNANNRGGRPLVLTEPVFLQSEFTRRGQEARAGRGEAEHYASKDCFAESNEHA